MLVTDNFKQILLEINPVDRDRPVDSPEDVLSKISDPDNEFSDLIKEVKDKVNNFSKHMRETPWYNPSTIDVAGLYYNDPNYHWKALGIIYQEAIVSTLAEYESSSYYIFWSKFYALRGVVHEEQDELELALADYVYSINFFPLIPKNYQLCASLLLRGGRNEDAIEVLHSLVQSVPHYLRGRNWDYVCDIVTGLLPKSVENTKLFSRVYLGDQPKVVCLEDEAQVESVLEHYEQAIKVDNEKQSNYKYYADLLLKLGRHEDARQVIYDLQEVTACNGLSAYFVDDIIWSLFPKTKENADYFYRPTVVSDPLINEG